MNSASYFELLPQLTDTPRGIEKIREMIIDLGITGKLVHQDDRDPPAAVAHDLALTRRRQLEANKAIKPRTLKSVASEEQSFSIPDGWIWTRLFNVGHELGQKIPDRRFTYIDVGAINAKQGRLGPELEQIDAADAPSRARKIVSRGTVIYSTVRPYLKNIAIIEHDVVPEPIASTAFGILHPFECIDRRYLFYWLRSGVFNSYVQAVMKGVAYPAINDESFYSAVIALPPLAEQRRIVAKVDELMGLCDRLEAQLAERETRQAGLVRASLAQFAADPTPANLAYLFHPSYHIPPAELRKTILTLAVQGKLVPQNPHDEPATTLLDQVDNRRERRATSRTKTSTGKLKPAYPNSGNKLPKSWTWCQLGRVVLDFRYGTSRKCSREMVGVPVLRIPNIKDGRIDSSDLKFAAMPQAEITDLSLRTGDLLFVRSNGSEELVGRCAVVSSDDESFVYAGYLVRARVAKTAVFPRYLQLALSTPHVRGQIEGPIRTTSGVKNINTNELSNLLIPLPPLPEQILIVDMVDKLTCLTDKLESHLSISNIKVAELLKEIVSHLTRLD